MECLHEATIAIIESGFPSGPRDFCLVQLTASGDQEPIWPLDLLGLERTAALIARLGREQPALGCRLALARLLVPYLRCRGSGRHLVIDTGTAADLRGETLYEDTRTQFALDLAREQAAAWQGVVSGERPPEGTLAELVWTSRTELPALPDTFTDADLSRFAQALYSHLVSEGDGMAEVSVADVIARLEACRAAGFRSLGLKLPARTCGRLLVKLLAVAVRWGSQLAGAVAEELVTERLRHQATPPAAITLTAAERDLLQLRYGACRALGDVNVGFLIGSDRTFDTLLNALFITHWRGTDAEVAGIEEELRKYVFLRVQFQQHRKVARADERQANRQRRSYRLPGESRSQTADPADARARPPELFAAAEETWGQFKRLIPHLKPRDARRVQALIDNKGNRAAVAARLGISQKQFSRQLRQTTIPNVRRAARKLGWQDLGELRE
jgi:hypothetical protein